MSSMKAHNAFWRGFGSVLSISPRRTYSAVKIVDVTQEASRDVAAAWADVGIHLRGAMDELRDEGRKQRQFRKSERDEACA